MIDIDNYDFEERAAILEYDAHMTRDAAEYTARQMIRERDRNATKSKLEIEKMRELTK